MIRSKLKYWLLTCAVAATTLATPTSRPADKPVRQVVEILSAQGAAALAAQDSRASIDAYLDAQQLISTDKTITATDPLRVQTAQGLAVAYLQAGKFEKAGDLFKAGTTLDKAMNTPAVTRSLVIDRTVLDFTQKTNIMRSIKLIKDFLAAHPDNDEELLNILGTALNRASYDERYSKAPLFEQSGRFYTDASARLEQTQPGKKRWGIEWISQGDFEDRSKERDKLVIKYNEAAAKLDQANADVRSAESNLENEKNRFKYGRGGDISGASNRLRSANDKASEAQRNAAEKKAAIPHFPWLTTLNPVMPGDGPTIVAIAPAEKPGGQAEIPSRTTGNSTKKPGMKPRETNDPGDPGTPRTGITIHPHSPPTAPTDTPPATVPPPATVTEPAPAPVHARVTRYAAAFPVGPDLLVTTAAAVDHAESMTLEDSMGNSFTAVLVRADEKTGLALLRVAGKRFAFLNAANQFAGGEVRCADFPTVAIFSPTPEVITGRSATIKPGDTGSWFLAMGTNPRLGGAPVVSADGMLVGVVMAQRDSSPQQVPAVRLDAFKAFMGDDLPNNVCSNPDLNYVLMLTATISK